MSNEEYAYIERIDEPEFGCEGVQEGVPICDEVTIRLNQEKFLCRVEERLIWENKIDENMWISKDMWNRLNIRKEV